MGFLFSIFFTAKLYSQLIDNDILGRIEIRTFFNYVMKKTWLVQTRIGLSLKDLTGEGNLQEYELESYIRDLVPELPQLKQIQEPFTNYYVHTVVRKFFFFLDPFRVNRVRIMDVLASGFLDSLSDLRNTNLTEIQLSENWFSAQSVIRIYTSYIQLDEDKNGLLSKNELAGYAKGILTEEFIDRVFQEFLTYNGQMDYKSYLDFVLAMENKSEPQSIGYFFRAFDIAGKGKLTYVVLKYFYDGITRRLVQTGSKEIVPFEDILTEIFDMGETVISLLIDVQGFLMYENREALVAESIEEAEL
ncbi:Serine/threonine-protein phosphatase 2A regulatory subunit B'' subunit gamma [Cichlidogyrus casuarinus]|uniref:Serine/threonine-protein phosphatase 2A regulatory subunit B'' subunit gamma n=1 Tax=Cichlidogyrus casuarinus TaxID=1844966 RepID=A0ABD2Q7Q9_9PLAT